MNLDKLLEAISSKSDWATVLISIGLGYLLEGQYDFLSQIDPSIFATSASSILLGVKKAYESFKESQKNKSYKLEEWVNNVIQFLNDGNKSEEEIMTLNRLIEIKHLFDREVIDRHDFEKEMDSIKNSLLAKYNSDNDSNKGQPT